jgi:hypothetical protein
MVLKWFQPQPDITAYELWLVLNNVGKVADINPVTFNRSTWESLIPELKRHFRDRDEEKA